MAQNFIACDREQELLLPPSLREWLPEEHLAWFVLDAVAEMDLAAFVASYRDDGWGRAAHDPAMMVALFVYAYAIGVRSSRAIERRCHDDVAFRVITANRAPDHATIARFRVRHEAPIADLFGEVLGLCARSGLVRVGVVAVDGTKIAAAAAGLGARAPRCDRARRLARGRDRQRRLAADGRRAPQHQALSAAARAGREDQRHRPRLAQSEDHARLGAGLQRPGRRRRRPDRARGRDQHRVA